MVRLYSYQSRSKCKLQTKFSNTQTLSFSIIKIVLRLLPVMTLHEIDTAISLWANGLQHPMEGILRLVLASVAGGLVGLEREIRGRQAGFRTNILVCMGSALVMVVSTSFTHITWERVDGVNINVDPARIAYGVMTGIGFLGAGTIVQAKGSVRGLTTAAALWCVAGIGLAAGLGLYVLSACAAMMVLAGLWVLDYFEDLLPKRRYRTVTVRCRWHVGCVSECVKYFQQRELEVIDAGFDRTIDMEWAELNLRIAFVDKTQYYELERELEKEGRYTLMATREL